MSEPSSNTPDRARWCELIDLHLLGTISKDEAVELEAALASSRDAREDYRQRCNVDAALRQEAAGQPMPTRMNAQKPARWLTWRPLTAAAAGIVFGMFCTSVVFGFVVQRGFEKKTPLAVAAPGFEDAHMPLSTGFPGGPGQWGGDSAQVVDAENGVTPKEGKLMLRLEPMSKGVPRIYQVLDLHQVLDLQSMPLSVGGESRDIEISASFASADRETAMRYVIRAFAVTEAPESLDAAWFDRREEAIASVTRGMDVTPGTKSWQTFNVKIQVPRAARSLVLFFGVRTPDRAARTSPHYLDDVRVSLLTPLPLP